jgi:hypothetical protein
MFVDEKSHTHTKPHRGDMIVDEKIHTQQIAELPFDSSIPLGMTCL